jgi:hypothetical protein
MLRIGVLVGEGTDGNNSSTRKQPTQITGASSKQAYQPYGALRPGWRIFIGSSKTKTHLTRADLQIQIEI